ncbi:MAG: hypothetical protein ACI4F1_08875 [Bariatricus sp.]
MTKIRDPKKYNISKNRFREVYYHCLQYNEWKAELEGKADTVKARTITGLPGAAVTGSATEALAMRREELRKKMEVIEQTAIEADPDLYQYILTAVTNEWATYWYLKQSMNMPCGQTKYYETRKKFYYLIAKKI